MEPVQTRDRTYVNGETLEADEKTIASLVSAGVAVRITEEIAAKPESKTELKETVEQTTPRRRRQQTEEPEEVI